MVNLYKYFELWNNIDKAIGPKTLLFVVLILISTSAGIYFSSRALKNINDKKSFVFGILCVVILGFSTFFGIKTRPNYKNQIINDVKIEIKEKFNINLTNKQIEKLVITQPEWANELTKKELKHFMTQK